MSVDVEKMRAEMRAGLEGVTPGPWGVDGYDIDGPIGNGDYVVLGEAWSSHKTQAHIARCSPDNIAALLDALDTAERERDEAREQRKQCATEIVDRVIIPALPKWQPIETAPKEHGEYVLLWIPGKNRRAIGWWYRDRYSKRPRPFWIWTIGSRHSISDCRANPPTHWQHLPMPPEGK